MRGKSKSNLVSNVTTTTKITNKQTKGKKPKKPEPTLHFESKVLRSAAIIFMYWSSQSKIQSGGRVKKKSSSPEGKWELNSAAVLVDHSNIQDCYTEFEGYTFTLKIKKNYVLSAHSENQTNLGNFFTKAIWFLAGELQETTFIQTSLNCSLWHHVGSEELF